MRNRNNFLSYLCQIGLFSLVILIGLISAMFGFPGLDEGLFIQIAKSMSEGARLYNDIPGIYGPLFHKINEYLFTCFGFSHYTSRLLVYFLGLTTLSVMAFTLRDYVKDGIAWLLIFPCLWFLSSTQRFSESLHPGWYIALLITLQSLVILNGRRFKYIYLGILSGLLLGFKPHLALINIGIIMHIIAITKKFDRIGAYKYLPSVFISILVIFILKTEIIRGSAFYCYPYFIVLSLIIYSAREVIIEDRKIIGALFVYCLSVFLIAFLIYFLASYAYGLWNMKLYMIDIPSKWFPSFYGDQYQLSNLSLTLLISTYIIIGCSVYFNLEFLKPIFILALGAGLLQTGIFSVHFFALLHFLLLNYYLRLGNVVLCQLTLLSAVQIFHLHPVAGTQVFYATPISWLLIAIYVKEVWSERIISGIALRYGLGGLIILCMSGLPIVRAYFSGEKIIKISSEIGGNDDILISKGDELELKELLIFLHKELKNNQSFLTIPRYDSVNIFLGVSPPVDVNSYYFSNLSEDDLKLVGEKLFSSSYLILFPESSRAKGVLDNQSFMDGVLKYQEFLKDTGLNYDKIRVYKLRRSNESTIPVL